MPNSTPPVDWIELLARPELPSAQDHLFTSKEDPWNNACLNWCHDGWGLYTSGYKDAADLLAKRVEERNAGQDSLVYPILFLYRQYLELQIKDLIRQAYCLQDISSDFPKHHHIGKLWEVCHKLLSEISPCDSVIELKEIARLIGEFSAVDPTSIAFRYPQDKEGSPSLPNISHINLRNVREVVGKISIILSGASIQVGEYLSIKQDVAKEFRHEW